MLQRTPPHLTRKEKKKAPSPSPPRAENPPPRLMQKSKTPTPLPPPSRSCRSGPQAASSSESRCLALALALAPQPMAGTSSRKNKRSRGFRGLTQRSLEPNNFMSKTNTNNPSGSLATLSVSHPIGDQISEIFFRAVQKTIDEACKNPKTTPQYCMQYENKIELGYWLVYLFK